MTKKLDNCQVSAILMLTTESPRTAYMPMGVPAIRNFDEQVDKPLEICLVHLSPVPKVVLSRR